MRCIARYRAELEYVVQITRIISITVHIYSSRVKRKVKFLYLFALLKKTPS